MHVRLAAVYPALVATGVLVLGAYQWRWIDRVTEADLAREQMRLARATQAVASEIDTEITRAVLFFADGDEGPPLAGGPSLQSQLLEWRAEAPWPGIVTGVLATDLDGKVRLHDLQGSATEYKGALPHFPGPPGTLVDGALAFPLMGGGGFDRRRGPPPPAFADFRPQPPRSERFLLINARELERTLLPRLVERRLGAESYIASLVAGPGRADLSDMTQLSVVAGAVRPDCLLGGRGGRGWGGGPRGGPRGGPPAIRREYLIQASSRCLERPNEGPAIWRLIVRHGSGHLGAAVLATRNRNRWLFASGIGLLLGALGAFLLAARRAQRLAQQQLEFAMSVSHELKTPLTVIRLAGDNLASGIVAPEQVRRYGERVRREAERLTGMVDQVLTFARSGQPGWQIETAPVDPEKIVDQAVSASGAILRDAGVELEREQTADVPSVQAEAGLAITALTNLLVNAATHGASGKYVRVRTFRNGDQVVFEVQDRGPGLPLADTERVLQPFVRGSQAGTKRGTGLGLHLVRRIAEAHGGSVEIESRPGSGLTVRLLLPKAAHTRVELEQT